MGDVNDVEAAALLRKIADLALSAYPFAEGGDANPIRLMTLGAIAAMASGAARDEPHLSPLLTGPLHHRD